MALWLLNQGLNTAMDRALLAPGELTVATGAYYKPGDTVRLWKILGRTSYGDAYSATSAGQALALFAFDANTTDKLVVLNANGELHASTLSTVTPTSGTFSTLTTGLTTGNTDLAYCHFDDVWYLSNSKNRPFAYESDNTLRLMGMYEPLTSPIPTATGGTSYTGRPTSGAGATWNDIASAFDTDDVTYAYTWMTENDAVDTTNPVVYTGFAADSNASRFLKLQWGVGVSMVGFTNQGFGDFNNILTGHFHVELTIEVSENLGSTWTSALVSNIFTPVAMRGLTVPVTANSDQIQVRITLKQRESNPGRRAQLRVSDIQLTNSGTGTETEVGLYYGLSEFDGVRGLEGPVQVSSLVTLSDTQTAVLLTLPSSAQNTIATNWRIYRTTDGGSAPGELRVIDEVPISATTYMDDFNIGKDIPGRDPVQLMKVQITDTDAAYYPINLPPGPFKDIVEYQNFLVAISEQFPRQLSYSYPSKPESWPAIYKITDFPLEEHDQLVALGVAGDLLVVGASEAIIVINGLPELEAQAYASADMNVLKNAPGCVGPMAMMAFSSYGPTRVAWVSPQGVCLTDGHTFKRISNDLDWETTFASADLSRTFLFYDRSKQVLKMGVDTDGNGLVDKAYWFHMAQEHEKQNGQPKITGPHALTVTNIVGGNGPDNKYRQYSLDNDTSGAVYVEDTGGTDASNGGSAVSFVATSGRQYADDMKLWAVGFPHLRHMSWGATPVVLTWSHGIDNPNESGSVVNTMTLTTQGLTKFLVQRSGDWHSFSIAHSGSATAAAIASLSFEGEEQGES